MTLQEQLVDAARSYCAAKGISLATLATAAVNDGKFFDRVGRGGSCTLPTYERLMAYMKAHPPAEAVAE